MTGLDVHGAWSKRLRRTYISPQQLGSGTGPYREVEDLVWDGCVVSADPVAGVLFRRGPDAATYWCKSLPPVVSPPLRVSLSRWVGDEGASLAVSFHGAMPPTAPVPFSGPCEIAARVAIGRATAIAAGGGVTFELLVVRGAWVKVGRNKVWRVRDGVGVAEGLRGRRGWSE